MARENTKPMLDRGTAFDPGMRYPHCSEKARLRGRLTRTRQKRSDQAGRSNASSVRL